MTTLHPLHQTLVGPIGPQIFARASLDVSPLPLHLSLRSQFHHQYPTHHHPMQAESVALPHRYMHNAPLLPQSNCAILHCHQFSHVQRQTPWNHTRPTTALFTLPPIHPPLHCPTPPSSRSLMANFCLFSTVPMKFWNLFLPAQQID